MKVRAAGAPASRPTLYLLIVLPFLGAAPAQAAESPDVATVADDVSSVVSDASHPWTATVYGARISSEVGWEDVLANPVGADYVDSYLVAAALARRYARYLDDGALVLEAEGQVVYNFGDQHHWEFNAVPIVVRWLRFPWSQRLATSAAFGLGLSYATELPATEVAIEGQSRQTLIYWVLELAAAPVGSPWAVTLRMHHRSVAFGMMGDDGGVNAVGIGVRYGFGRDK